MKSKETIIERAVQYLITSSDEEISRVTVRDVSGALRVPFVLLAVIFPAARRETFRSFVERQKLFRAAGHLEKNKEMKIAELSKRLGFTSQGDFSEKFKKYFLINPERYWELAQIKKYTRIYLME